MIDRCKILKYLAENNARISYGSKWMYVEDFGDGYEFTVLQRPPYAKKNRVLYEGKSLEDAIDKMEDIDLY